MEQLLRNGLKFLFLYLSTQNLLLDLPVVSTAVEEVLLIHPIVDATAESPHVNLAVEVRHLHYHFRSRVVYVPAEVALFDQLLEVEWHSYMIEFYAASKAVKSARVNVSVDNPHLVHVLKS